MLIDKATLTYTVYVTCYYTEQLFRQRCISVKAYVTVIGIGSNGLQYNALVRRMDKT